MESPYVLSVRMELSKYSRADLLSLFPIPQTHPLYRSLKRLEANPVPNGYVTAEPMPPVFIYHFDDGDYQIAYALSRLRDEYLVSIYSIEKL